ncbi:PilW family protein [Chitinibacter fontanus]|uniref:PilW family protein n=1 Tax=Chitinibacter fontanus TaxID=1737446 RepID=A0A7D5Z5D6_9NEIS|nr:PilW family protein [Chitinibacter fontanus]QLI80762.1 PilW family protein [Chitinibacter fontanus]
MDTFSRQTGFTLVELMVGLTLALLLTLGIANIYVQTRQTFRSQTALSRMTEDGKYAMASLQRMMFQAGFQNTSSMKSNMSTAFPAGYGMAAGTVIKGNDTSVDIRFLGDPDGNIITCAQDSTGNSDYPLLTTNQQYAYRLSVENSQLKCGRLDNTGSTVSNQQVLADNIVDFNLVYGVDSDNDRLTDTYTDAPTNWANVYSVRACMVVRSRDDKISVSSTGKSYLNCSFPDHAQQSVSNSDGHLYRTFSTTLYLRNKPN